MIRKFLKRMRRRMEPPITIIPPACLAEEMFPKEDGEDAFFEHCKKQSDFDDAVSALNEVSKYFDSVDNLFREQYDEADRFRFQEAIEKTINSYFFNRSSKFREDAVEVFLDLKRSISRARDFTFSVLNVEDSMRHFSIDEDD